MIVETSLKRIKDIKQIIFIEGNMLKLIFKDNNKETIRIPFSWVKVIDNEDTKCVNCPVITAAKEEWSEIFEKPSEKAIENGKKLIKKFK